MDIEIRHERTIRSRSGRSRTGSSFHTHYREVHAVFDELIHRPWGVADWSPTVDVWETADAFLIEMDVPGVSEDDIAVMVEDRLLVIRGHRSVGHADENHVPHSCERPEGRFARTFRFDEPLHEDRVEYQVRAGVLIVTVAKPHGERTIQDEQNAEHGDNRS